MLGDLSKDLIGTDPKYPKIVNQEWLNVNTETYDNYPSDNNPVRIQPKLSEIWNTDDKGPQIMPNQTVQPLGIRADNETEKIKTLQADVIRAAKKAMMSGMKGVDISKHLKSLFTPDILASVQDGLKKLASEEMGLLGNVYIDASAFDNYNDAEKFMNQHRNRLARDILFEIDKADPVIVSSIAQKFRKNVVSSINYDEKLLAQYKEHLILAGRIPSDYVIDSKEALRKAFLLEPEKEPTVKRASQPIKKLSKEEVSEGLKKISENKALKAQDEADQIRLAIIRPVLSFVQENISRGKTGEFLKEVIRKKFSTEDIQNSADCITLAVSGNGLDSKNIDALIESGKLSSIIGEELKKIAKQWPVKKATVPEYERYSHSNVQGYMYALSGRKQGADKLHQAVIIALQRGTEVDNIRDMLLKRLSSEETELMLSRALNEMNSVPAGVVANRPKNTKKAIIVEDPNPPKQKLPPEESITAELKEFHDFFKDASTDIDLGSEPENLPPLDVEIGVSGAGIDENLN